MLKMNLKKALALLASVLILCTVLPLSALFATAEAVVIENTDFNDGELHGWSSSSVVSVEDGALKFECTKDWANVYKYANGMKANTDYVYTFKAKTNMNSTMNIKINDNWGKDSAHVTFDATTEWQEFVVDVNSGNYTSAPILMFSANVPASTGLILYIDYVIITEKTAEPEAPAEPEIPADAIVIENTNFNDGELHGWSSSSVVSVEDGALKFECTKDWANVYKYANGMKANTDYVYTFKAKTNINSTMNIKINDNWGGDTAHVTFDATTEWQEFVVDVNSGNYTSAPILMFSANVPASTGLILYIDYVIITEKTAEPETPSEPENKELLVNGGFEDGLNGWEINDKYASLSTDARTGNGALQLKNISKWGGAALQTIEVKPDTDYTIVVWSRRVEGTGAFNLYTMNAADSKNLTRVSGENWFNKTSTDWVKNEIVVNTGSATAMTLKWSSETDNAGTLLVDDMSIIAPAEPETPDEPVEETLIKNGGFENELADWTNLWNGCTVSFVEGYNSSKAISIIAGGWAQVRQDKIPVDANSDYILSAWVKDANNFALMTKKGDDSGDIASVMLPAGSEWTKVELNFNTGDQTAICALLIGWDGGGSATIDDVTLVKVGGSEPETPAEESFDGYLYNGDFETGELGHWTLTTDGASGVVADAAKDGNYGMKLQGNAWAEILYSNIIPAIDGVTYTITFDTKGLSAGAYQIQVKNCPSAEKIGSGNNFLTEKVTVTEEWKTVTLSFKAGPTGEGDKSTPNDYFTIMFVKNENANVYVDNVVVTSDYKPADPEVPAENIFSADFESGELDGWSSSSNLSNDEGTMKFDINKDWGNVYRDVSAMKANTDYTLTFKAKANKSASLWVKLNDNWGPDIMKADLKIGTEWADYTVTLNAADKNAAALLLLQYSGYGSEGTIIWFDDFVMAPVGGSTPDAPATNLIVNGDFETGDATGWETWQDTVIDDVAANNGNYGAHLKGNGSWGGMLNQTMTVEAGKTYKLSFWIHVMQNGVNCQVKDGSGKSIEGAGAWFDSSNQDKVVEWTFVAPDNTVLINFCGAGNGTAENVLVDDFVLVEYNPNAGGDDTAELIIDGSFETGKLPGKHLVANSGWVNLWDAVSYEFVEDGVEGLYALSFNAPKQWQQIRQDCIAVEKNTKYTLSAWIQGAKDFQIVVKSGDDSTNIKEFTVPSSSSWEQYSFDFNTGDFDSICVLLISCGESGGSAMIDAVKLEREAPALIIDGGFELGELTGKSMTAGTGWHNLYNAITYEFVDGLEGKSLSFSVQKNWAQIRQDCIPVEKNTDYVLTAWVQDAKNFGIVVKKGDDSGDLTKFPNNNAGFESSTAWTEQTIEFNSGDCDSICVLLISNDKGKEEGAHALIDNVVLQKKSDITGEPDKPKTPAFMTSYGVVNNRPFSADMNLIDGDFENGTLLFEGNSFSIVDDATAPSGNKSLYFNTSASNEEVSSIIAIDVKPDTAYVFSTWIKGAYISDDNRFNATIGVSNEKGRYLAMSEWVFLNGKRQIVPTAWDNQWHLRSVEFNTAGQTKIYIKVAGTASQMWLDDIALFEVGNGRKYMSENMAGSVSLNFENDIYTCQDEDSLIPDPNFDTKDKSGFWADSYGWKNGFLSFAENKYEYGTSLKYTGSEETAPLSIVKWIDVEPNTEYTFAVDLKILESGAGKLVLVDDKMRNRVNFLQVSFDEWDYDEANAYYGWYTTVANFNTGVYERIGIAVVDDGGEVLLDNMRLYLTEDADASVVDEYIPAPEKEDEPETDEPETDEPETDEPETDEPETDEPETDEPEADEPETDEPETDEPETDEPETDEPETDEPETNEPETNEPEANEPADKPADDSNSPWLWIGIGAGVLVLAAVVLVIILGKKKKAA